jgi:RNA polymerase sigma-70 factor, ECF subfamily
MSIGNARAFDGLLVTEYLPLLRYARRLTSDGGDAADLVHTVVAKVLANRDRLAMPDNITAWLRAVLFRAFIDGRRRAVRESLAEESMLDRHARWDRAAAPAEPLPPSFSVTMDEARAVISALPAHYREPYELYTFEHLSYDQIAERLALSAKTVGSRLNRARGRLRALLKAQRGRRRPARPGTME